MQVKKLLLLIMLVWPHMVLAVNVLDFGAKGDGLHDDTPAFRKAIVSAVSGDRKLYIPTGTYLVGDIELPANNFHIRGEGAYSRGGSRLILKKGATTIFHYEGKRQCHTLYFERLVFDGHNRGDGIRLYAERMPPHAPFNIYTRDVRFEHCRIGFFAPRIFASEWRNLSIDHCTQGGIVGLTGPSNILQSVILQHIPKGAVGIHIYGNNAHIVGLNASFGAQGAGLVVGRDNAHDGRNGVAWVRVQSSHFENFSVTPVEVRGGSRLALEDVEFFANATGVLDAFIRIRYANRTLWMNNVRFHSKGAKVVNDILIDNRQPEFRLEDIPGVRRQPVRVGIVKAKQLGGKR